MMPSLIAAFLLQAAAAPTTAPVCAAPVAPPAGLEAWSGTPTATADVVAPGKPAALTLQPAATVNFALTPERAPAPGTFGGVYHLTVAAAGTYRIALQAGAWIDVVRDGKSLSSVAHMEGPPCSGVRKIVDFALQPGVYALQLSGAKTAQLRILVATK